MSEPERAQQRSGYIDVSTGSNVFYWSFESRSDPLHSPLVIWLTGGPGCSSELAVFYEQGPFRFNEDGSGLSINEFAWNAVANMLYIDQPRGTGFSYVDRNSSEEYVLDENMISDDLYEFLQKFLATFPEYVGRDVFVTGESYAGHYIPVFASRILRGNDHHSGIHIPLKGVAIGNGWVNSYYQFPAMLEYAKLRDLVVNNTNLHNKLEELVGRCQEQLMDRPDDLLDTFQVCVMIEQYLTSDPSVQSRPFNYYDVRRDCIKDGECYDFSPLNTLLDSPDVLDSLGVDPRHGWNECDNHVQDHLIGDQLQDCDHFLPPLLERGIPVLIYNGVEDLLCNYLGTEAWINAMEWNGTEALAHQEWTDWYVEEVSAGRWKQVGALTVVEVMDSGHMVPMDQPQRALAMLTSLIGRSPL